MAYACTSAMPWDFSVSNSSNIVSTSPKAYLLFKMVLVTSVSAIRIPNPPFWTTTRDPSIVSGLVLRAMVWNIYYTYFHDLNIIR
ncbi:hypothetical protein PISMIDRAFT_684018 [Pisolithus microcarpus 441]|uniref:Uncharacterized protein n=1 Tax=Pisolithus microcarpus 441 TaxID=765257 RepID=A0A0C9YPP5_9AGAM|nr:hypothetical protein PISMIDRAFT_684018 [Pisolithus microcarpus 441]